MNQLIERHEVHHNGPQLEYLLIQAAMTLLLLGRGGGKSKPLAHRLKICMDLMPKSVGRFSAYTYLGMLDNVLPGVIQCWEEDYHLVEGIHFWVNRWPPKELNIPRPYFAPRGDGKHLICWPNGSVAILTSMDRSIYNGSNFDWFVGDEVRISKKEKFSELLRAMRGNKSHFSWCWLHHSIMFATDMPQDPSGNWLFEYIDLQDHDVNHMIKIVAIRANQIRLALPTLKGAQLDEAETLLEEYDKHLNTLRKRAVHVIEASSLENVHALGMDVILRMKRDSTEFEFDVAILNLKPGKVTNGFYALLDENTHGYTSMNYDYIDQLERVHRGEIKPNWKWYNDYNIDQPLQIGCDHNNAINWIVTGQPFYEFNKFRIQSAMYVKSPDYIKQCVEEWCKFYKDFPTNTVVYHYDATHIKSNSNGDKSEMDIVIETLRSHGWRVEKNYLSSPSFHTTRYSLWQNALKGGDEKLLNPEFNMTTCETLVKGMQQTKVIQLEGKFKKDKRTERKNKSGNYDVPPELAPHGSEACDVLFTGVNKNRYSSTKQFLSAVSS